MNTILSKVLTTAIIAGVCLPMTTRGEENSMEDNVRSFLKEMSLTPPGVTLKNEVQLTGILKDQDDSSSDMLANYYLSVDAELNDWIYAFGKLKWEEDATDGVDLDEVFMLLGATETFPFYGKAGKFYLPFGMFTTLFVTDPVTKKTQLRESTLAIGADYEWFDISGAMFNGDADGSENKIDEGYVSLSLYPAEGLQLSAYWVSDVAECGGLEDGVNKYINGTEATTYVDADGYVRSTSGTTGKDYERVGGAGASASYAKDQWMLIGEYIAVLEELDAGILGDSAEKPATWYGEFQYQVLTDLRMALRYEGTSQFPGMPESRYGLAGKYVFNEYLSLIIEYTHGEFDDDESDADILLTRLILAF